MVTETSAERCRKAFDDWYSQVEDVLTEISAIIDRHPSMGLPAEERAVQFARFKEHARAAWDGCWQYLEKNAYKEFIEK